MKKCAVLLIGVMLISGVAVGMTVPQAIKDVTEIVPPNAYNCVPVTEQMHDRLYGMQKSELMSIAVYNGRKGHRFLLYRDFGDVHIVTTWTENQKDFKIRDIDLGRVTLHDVCMYLMPDYSFIRIYNRGQGAMYYRVIPRSKLVKDRY